MRQLLLLFLFLPFSGKACLNDFVHDSNGNKLRGQINDVIRYTRNFDNAYLKELVDWYRIPGNIKNYKDSSDYAVALIKYGEVNKARIILEALEKTHSTEYTIAANLGTCYELCGLNEAALRFIKKGMELNPESHEGTEWVHVAILEAKIAIAKDPDWLKTHTVLPKRSQKPVLTSRGSKPDNVRVFSLYDDFEKSVIYQLKERLPFTTPPDAIVFAILKQLGEYEEKAAIEFSIFHYRLAQEYAGGNDPNIKSRINNLNKQLVDFGTGYRDYHSVPFDINKRYVIRDKPLNAVALSVSLKADTASNKNQVAAADSVVVPSKSKQDQQQDDSGRSPLWIFVIGGIVLFATGTFLWLKKRN